MRKRSPVLPVAIVLIAAICLISFLWRQPHQAAGPSTQPSIPPPLSVDLILGNPSGATTDPANRANYLMLKPFYSLSYNDSKGIPNWVAWRLTKNDLGDAPRKQLFDPDTTLPPGFYQVTHKDYTSSGYDRGHLCPHADRGANQEMSFATFVMTNIIPQAPVVNQKEWAHLEDYCRGLVKKQNDRLYIIAGPSGTKETLPKAPVTVPAGCWKIVVAVPEAGGDDDLAKITPSTRVITVIMPNDPRSTMHDWGRFRTTPAEVERRTGFKFFDRLRPEIADKLREKIDNE